MHCHRNIGGEPTVMRPLFAKEPRPEVGIWWQCWTALRNCGPRRHQPRRRRKKLRMPHSVAV